MARPTKKPTYEKLEAQLAEAKKELVSQADAFAAKIAEYSEKINQLSASVLVHAANEASLELSQEDAMFQRDLLVVSLVESVNSSDRYIRQEIAEKTFSEIKPLRHLSTDEMVQIYRTKSLSNLTLDHSALVSELKNEIIASRMPKSAIQAK